MNPDTVAFPESKGDGCEPFRKIASELDLTEDFVLTAFRGLPVPEWSTSQQLAIQREHALLLNRATATGKRFLEAYNALPLQETELLLQGGAITLQQLEQTIQVLIGDAEQMERWSGEHDRTGGRNPASYTIAEGIRRVFRRKRWRITFGQDNGKPSTDFGRAVEMSLQAFGLAANWRNPTDAAYSRHIKMQSRLHRWAIRALNS